MSYRSCQTSIPVGFFSAAAVTHCPYGDLTETHNKALIGELEELPLLINHECPIISTIVQTRLTKGE